VARGAGLGMGGLGRGQLRGVTAQELCQVAGGCYHYFPLWDLVKMPLPLPLVWG
jgi:hypothetical protein